jgi:ABC-type phosphate/phosphonate transport system substrate-binding protein
VGVSRGRAVALAITAVASLGAIVALGPFREDTHDSRDRSVGPAAHDRTVLSIVVAPWLEPDAVPSELEPLARYLEGEVGVTVELSRAESYRAAVDAVVDGESVVAMLPPLAWVQASEDRPSVKLLALQSFESSYTLDSILVVRRGEGIDEPEDLRGRPACLVDPLSASGNLLARSWVRSRGIDPATLLGHVTWSGGHLPALRDLLEERCDVAAVSSAALRVGPARGIDVRRLDVMATTGHVPVAAWAGSPRLDEGLADALTEALASFVPPGTDVEPWLGDTLRIGRFQTGSRTAFRSVWVSAQLEGVVRR